MKKPGRNGNQEEGQKAIGKLGQPIDHATGDARVIIVA